MHERGETERFKSIPLLHLPHPSSFPYSAWPQTLAFCMEGSRETIISLCLEKKTPRGDKEKSQGDWSFQVLCPKLKAQEGPLPA